MQLIVGLGNPGEKYKHTRHNVGFMVVDELPLKSRWKKEKYALSARLDAKNETEVIRPLTTMNRSGTAIAHIIHVHKVAPNNILVVHDELDMIMGEVKMTFGKSAAKHNGVSSVVDILGTKNFWRLRIGIAPLKKPPAYQMKKFVIKKMTPQQEKKLRANNEKITEGILRWARNHEKGMQYINTK